MADLSVKAAGVSFNNPLIAASGTFGFGREYNEFYPLEKLGGISCKGITLKRRDGNPPPRIAETPSGILNAVGLQNPGVDAFISDDLPWLKQQNTTVIANIAGNTVEEYCQMAEKLSETDVDMITDIASIAQSAEANGADAISMINTLTGMKIDINTRRPIIRNNTGGLSGAAVFPVAVRMVWQVSNAVKIPIIGMGGITTWEDAAEMLIAGATALQIGTVMLSDPYAPIKINEGLNKFLDDNGIKSVTELTKTVKPW